jgi:hypothetical protein
LTVAKVRRKKRGRKSGEGERGRDVGIRREVGKKQELENG